MSVSVYVCRSGPIAVWGGVLTRAPASHFPQSETIVVESFLSGDEAVSEGKMEGAGSRFPLRAFPPSLSACESPRGSEATNGKSVCAQRGERTGRWPEKGQVCRGAESEPRRERSHERRALISPPPLVAPDRVRRIE